MLSWNIMSLHIWEFNNFIRMLKCNSLLFFSLSVSTFIKVCQLKQCLSSLMMCAGWRLKIMVQHSSKTVGGVFLKDLTTITWVLSLLLLPVWAMRTESESRDNGSKFVTVQLIKLLISILASFNHTNNLTLVCTDFVLCCVWYSQVQCKPRLWLFFWHYRAALVFFFFLNYGSLEVLTQSSTVINKLDASR